ncbi:UROD/MetE-like protein [Dacryopinax primogenitus]|uniref:UROD/MetE-like protein n=1 Tax=Dacryopinax primogenitus (strain DJM 731) TaxID=1858805 RepID=M5G975_DACPD|nr:UROD/MetE-like protein [Dacryopinax primogenitus]EJU05314.1 UROD/MetE-like protein [Dacryopinax primogenitus]
MAPPPPFRAEHIGSLKRPRHLIDARTKFDKGEVTREKLTKLEDEEVLRVVKLQQKLGFKAITDGEFRRHMFYDGFFDNLEGFTLFKDPNPDIFMDYVPDVAAFKALGFKGGETYLCTGKIKRTKPCYVPWFLALAKDVAPEEVKNIKIAMAAPEWYHLRHSGEYAYSHEVYANDAEYFADIAQAYREEIDALYEAGCRNIQIDDPLLAYFCAVSMLEGLKAVGDDPDKLLDSYIKLYNDCLATKKPDFSVGLHLCRGNFKDGVHFSEGGYDAIAVKLFNELNADFYYLEYDTPRAGGFAPLKELPKHKQVVLGLISSKLPKLEDKKEVIARIHEAAGYMDDPKLERIGISPQCGFASHIEGNLVTEADVEKKLALVAEIATEVFGTTVW